MELLRLGRMIGYEAKPTVDEDFTLIDQHVIEQCFFNRETGHNNIIGLDWEIKMEMMRHGNKVNFETVDSEIEKSVENLKQRGFIQQGEGGSMIVADRGESAYFRIIRTPYVKRMDGVRAKVSA